jgi:CRP/FNR family transcriptional regulator, cyclic AMP receptor protein
MQLDDIFWQMEPYVSFKAGEFIFKEGEPGDFMYVLIEGQVEVRIKENEIGIFEPLEVFGEMALIDSQPRSATIAARTDCKLIRVNQSRFKMFVQKSPQFGVEVMRTMVERIRWMNSQLQAEAAAAAAAAAATAANAEQSASAEPQPATEQPAV